MEAIMTVVFAATKNQPRKLVAHTKDFGSLTFEIHDNDPLPFEYHLNVVRCVCRYFKWSGELNYCETGRGYAFIPVGSPTVEIVNDFVLDLI